MANSTANTEKTRFIERSCLYTNKENPFCNLKIDDYSFLDDVSARGTCRKCNKSRRYYCYNCYVPIAEIENKIPKVQLPIPIDIIKHAKEVDGKSTSAHAAVIASEHVRVFIYPDIPSYANEKVILIFPGESAVSLKDLWSSHSAQTNTSDPLHFKQMYSSTTSDDKHFHQTVACCCNNPLSIKSCDNTEPAICSCSGHKIPFDRVVFIDSTWRQTKVLYRDPRLHSLPCVSMMLHKSVFWRHQRGKPESYLSTIEAIYYFLVELHLLQHSDVPYCGRYDNLLFFFKFMYYKIRTLYDPTTLKTFQAS